MSAKRHAYWMLQALELARKAQSCGEVPVGALLVEDDRLIGSGYNQPISSHDPTAHAEIVAIREAAMNKGNYRLPGTTLYVTIEPCTMCVGAIVHARIALLVFGAVEPRAGAVISQMNVLSEAHFNHKVEHESGVLEPECAKLLQDFFKSRRNSNL
jgi:tRNA(adenine34) deaminase